MSATAAAAHCRAPFTIKKLPFRIPYPLLLTLPLLLHSATAATHCRAAFTFKKLPFKIPYPVPFKLLGDERKGFIDVTYLSPDGRLRLSRGNKASTWLRLGWGGWWWLGRTGLEGGLDVCRAA